MRRDRWSLIAVAVVVAWLSLAGRAAAQEGPPSVDVTATLEPRAATLGDRVELTITVRHGTELQIAVSEPRQVSNVDLVATSPEEVVFDDRNTGVAGRATTTVTFTLAAFNVGDLRPGDVEVSWLRADGATGTETVRPPILRIQAVRAADDAELRPLKPQASVGGAPLWWQRSELAWGLGGLALAAAGAAWWLRRSPAPVLAPVLTPRASLEDRARARLDALQGLTLSDREAYRKFYGELSIAIRSYLEARFGFKATAFTTRELGGRFEHAGIGRWQARLVSGLLERCDAAVYARAQPDPASADHDLTVAYEIIELSRPRRRAEGEPQAVSA